MLRVSTNADASTYGDRRITKLLMGDIPPGSLVFVHGESDTGKSVLCQQLSYNALYNNTCSVAYFTSDGKPDALLDRMELFSFHVHYHFISDKFRVYPLKSINSNPCADESVGRLLQCLEDLPPSFALTVIDSINPLLAGISVERQLTLLHDIKLLGKEKLRSIILVTSPHVFARNVLPRLYSLCDYYLGTDNAPVTPGLEQMDCRTMRSLEIRKMDGVETPMEPLRFEIRTGSGIHILPYVTVRA